MSLVGFDTLRDRHRDRADDIARLEVVVERIVRGNPAARLEELPLANRSHVPLSDIETFLVELCIAGVLEPRVFWNCPNGHGVAEEASAVSELPEQVECECGQIHFLDPDDIEVGFIPSARLQESLAPGSH